MSFVYKELLNRSAGSKKRVILSALYLGTGDKERSLVSALEQNVSSNQDLK
jgi:hypothetical protein